MRAQVGAAVGQPRPFHWSPIEGTSRRRLPALLSSVGEIDTLHPRQHFAPNAMWRFELDLAVEPAAGGAAAPMIVDDIDLNWGFNAFVKTHRRF